MKILALELSSGVGSVALCEDEATRDFRTFPADRKDSAFFYQNLQLVFKKDEPLDLIVVGLGPGSYAGTRIAIATALGLRAASGAKLCGLPSVCAIEREEYLFVGDARRHSYFYAQVAQGKCLAGPILASAAELEAKLAEMPSLPVVATERLDVVRQALLEHPSALRLAELAARAEFGTSEILEPIYLRAPYITTPKK